MATATAAPVRLAILGAGTIGTIHALASLEAPEARVTRIWSRSPQHAARLAERVGAATAATVDEAVSAADVDAVIVATPTFVHEEQALSAITAGKHVICEKPLARDLAAAERIVAAAERAGVQLHVGHVARFFPEFARLHEEVLAGRVGAPAVVRMSRMAGFPHGADDWHNRPEASGGVILDMGIHDLDWLLWTLGPAQRVFARGLAGAGLDYLDYALITVRHASGAIAHVESSWAESGGFRVQGEVAGDRGLLAYDSANSTAFSLDLRREPEGPPGVAVPTAYTATSPYVDQLRAFCRSIGEGAPAPVTPEEALAALRLTLGALESARTGRAVVLEGGAA